jgi:hypothetical protein
MLSDIQTQVYAKDPIIEFLNKDSKDDFNFKSQLRMLPMELVERFGSKLLEDQKEYEKYCNLNYDVFYQEWLKHYNGYWEDKLQLITKYITPMTISLSPLELHNSLNDLMIKIERRGILLRPDPKSVDQKQTRLNGDEKDYHFIRSYWVDDRGEKKRMIARHVGNRYDNIEKEIADLFHNRGFAVHRNYRSEKRTCYDMVIELAGMKTVVEVKLVSEKMFDNLFMFDELVQRFNKDYKKE